MVNSPTQLSNLIYCARVCAGVLLQRTQSRTSESERNSLTHKLVSLNEAQTLPDNSCLRVAVGQNYRERERERDKKTGPCFLIDSSRFT